MDKKYILSIDSGSTGIRAVLFNHSGDIVAREYEKTQALYPEPGAIEHDPIMLWEALLKVVKRLFAAGKFKVEEVAALGICNQRASFILWEKATGKPLCNAINWADTRSAKLAAEMNSFPKLKRLKSIAGIVASLTGNTMLTATRMLTLVTDFALVRLKWFFNNHPDIYERCKAGEVLFGTLDTWYIYNLTGKKNHVTDCSNATSTTMFNPFTLKWNDIYCNMFEIPMNIFPEVKDTNGDFGITERALFGAEIPIRAAAGDQQAALFGQCCFNRGDVKISQGSGAFVDMNVGPKAKLSKRGLLPIVAWVLNGQKTYLLESFVATAGTLIDWLGQGIGLSDTPKILNELANQATDTEGVIFIPSNSGFRFPYNKPTARGSILGLSLSTHRRHVARAVLEGLALSLFDIIEGIQKDTKVMINNIKVDGGVSKSDCLLQILADISQRSISRAPESDMTATGAAYFAGLSIGFWKDQKEILSLQKGFDEFRPKMDAQIRKQKITQWRKVVKSVMKAY
jgi:glycerol kinase